MVGLESPRRRMEEREKVRSVKAHYRSGRDDLARDFFAPCLNSCVRYRRAAGFFSSSALITWAGVLPGLARGASTRIQLLIAPVLSPEDRDVLREMIDPAERDRFLQKIADRVVLEALAFAEMPEDTQLRRRLFAWMIATGRLDLRFAFPRHVDDAGIFHEKIGLFDFPWGDQIAFTGSANESTMGHSRNYETVDVYRGWLAEDGGRVAVKEEQFDEAWDGQAEGLTVAHLSEECLAKVKSMTHDDPPERVHERPSSDAWRHQDDAVAAFLAEARGVLEMATGTGKTRTALRICEHLASAGEIDTIVVAADGTDLLDQWYAQLTHLSQRLPSRFAVYRQYSTHKEREEFTLDPRRSVLLSSRRFLGPALRVLAPTQASRTILIHDEVHRLGSAGNREELGGLSDAIRYRLGLSATPEREYDAEGSAFIAQHIGPVIFRFELADAIRRGILAPFDYYPIEWRPDAHDRERIQQVHKKAKARDLSGAPMSDAEIWTEVAMVYKTSRVKVPLFERVVAEHPELLTRCIIFVATKEYGGDILEIVHRHRVDFHTYFAEDESETLRRFASGKLECLITCHRLSEGIDIQSLSTVILVASDRARLETIQRMGRCLRIDPKRPQKRANVVDFVRVRDAAENNQDDTPDMERRDWLKSLSSIVAKEGTA